MNHQRLSPLHHHGRLKNTGRFFIYPVDQGIERGPLQCFSSFLETFDPFYHAKLALDIGASAYACPIGAMETIAQDFHDKIPLILKLNTSNRLYLEEPNQALIASVEDALNLKCLGIGLTIYPGSNYSLAMMEQASKVILEAKSHGLFTVIWSYARGGKLKSEDETAFDVICYAAHIAAQLGADVIKVKIPSSHIFDKTLTHFENLTLKERISYVVRSSLRRPVVFSGGEAKDYETVIEEVKAVRDGGGHGSIMGRNLFQRPYEESLELANDIMDIYLS